MADAPPHANALRTTLLSVAGGLAIAACAMWAFKWYYFRSTVPAPSDEEIAAREASENARQESKRRLAAQSEHRESEQRRVAYLSMAPPAIPIDAALVRQVEDEAISFTSKVRELNAAKDINGLEAMADEARKSTWNSAYGEPRIVLFYRLLTPSVADLNSWMRFMELNDRWRTLKPNSPTPIAAALFALDNKAWRARGSGYAVTVNPGAAAEFRQTLEETEFLIRDAKSVQQFDPAYYAKLIDIGKGLGWSRARVDEAFNAGRKIDPSFMPVYTAMAEYLLPRWHGKPGEVEQFARTCMVDAGAKLGDEIYARIALQVCRYEGDAMFVRTDFEFPRILQGWRAMDEEYRNSVFLVNQLSWLATLAGDAEAGKELLAVMKDRYDPVPWGPLGGFERFLDMVDPGQTHALWDRVSPKGEVGKFDVDISRDGRWLATAGTPLDGNVCIRETMGSDWRVLSGLRRTARSVAFRPDGQMVAAAGDSNRVVIWHLNNESSHRELLAPFGHLNQVSFSPNGTSLLALSHRGALCIWDLERDASATTLSLNGIAPARAEFSADGCDVLTLEWNGRIRRLNVGTGDAEIVTSIGPVSQTISYLNGHIASRPPALGPTVLMRLLDEHVEADWRDILLAQVAAIEPTSNTLATVERVTRTEKEPGYIDTRVSTSIMIWDVKERELVGEFSAGDYNVTALRFSSDGNKLVWLEEPGVVKIRDFKQEPLPQLPKVRTKSNPPSSPPKREPVRRSPSGSRTT